MDAAYLPSVGQSKRTGQEAPWGGVFKKMQENFALSPRVCVCLFSALFLVTSSCVYDYVWSSLWPRRSAGIYIEKPRLVGAVGGVTHSVSHLPFRDAFLLGNSVTRHYAFKLCKGNIELPLDRQQEKQMCETEVGVSSCDLYCNSGRTVSFRWANLLGSELSTDPRDVCLQFKTIESCFSDMFSNATETDLLVIGSIPIEGMPTNVTKKIWHTPFEVLIPAVREYLDVHKIAGFLSKVLKHFPGNIRWHSFPFLKIDADTKGSLLQKHLVMLREMNDGVARAIEGVNNPRLKFVDVWNLQKQNIGKYADLIHHPGNLSEAVVEQILQSLNQSEGDFGLKSYTLMHSQSDYSSPAIIFQCPTGTSVEWGQYKGDTRPGWSDHQVGAIGAFLVSLLLRMPFFIDCHIFSELYEENMIKWKWHTTEQYSEKNGPVKYLDKYGVPLSVDDIDKFVQNVVQSNRGVIASLSEQELQKWNLSHQNSFSLAHKYLFKADGLALQGVEKTRIGPMITVQLRLGDAEIHGSCRSDAQECLNIQDTRVQQFVRCTTKLHRIHNLSKSTMYILSDCDCLRKQLKSYFESTLDIEVLAETAPTVTATDYDEIHAMKSFVGGLEVASRADFFIISQDSGVGRQVVARAQRFTETFWGHLGEQCGALDFNAIARGWSGL